MNKRIKTIFPLLVLTAGLGLMLTDHAAAKTFTTLHNFTGGDDGTTSKANLVLSGDTLYGTAGRGGTNGTGMIFSVNTNGSGYKNLYSFTAFDLDSNSFATNGDGISPIAGLILSGNTLYGTAAYGGISGAGTVFAINTNGTSFTNLHNFTSNIDSNTNSDGYDVANGLFLSGNTLYGASYYGGANNGTLFSINTNGTAFKDTYNFAAVAANDGSNPDGGLILYGNKLYGTTQHNGSSGYGTVFSVNTDGAGLTNLHSFGFNDGAGPSGSLAISGNTLYGTCNAGGALGFGTVFAVNTNGTGFKILHDFTVTGGSLSTNSDGAAPQGGLIISGSTLYGATQNGGSAGNGTVFAVNTNGTGFTTLYSFTALNNQTNSDGVSPYAALIIAGNTLYGTTPAGGSAGNGTVFSLTLPPPPPPLQINVINSLTKVILSWPTNAAGFILQSAPSVNGTFTNILGATSPYTNPITGGQQFFQLISN